MTCWIYDLDGVVTNLTEKKITNLELLKYFIQQLQNQELVTINTGRGLPFIREKVMVPLLAYLQQENLPESLLHNFFAVGEKGNAWIEDEKDCFDLSSVPPQALSEKVERLIAHDFADTMFFDNTKRTMISTEFLTGTSLHMYIPEQKKLIALLQNMLVEEGLDDKFKLDPNATAVDIEAKTAGKALGTERILSWLRKRGIEPDTFVAFGDSNADIGTGEALQKAGKKFTFVFVGNPQLITSHQSFPITFTKDKYDKGVIEFLEKFS